MVAHIVLEALAFALLLIVDCGEGDEGVAVGEVGGGNAGRPLLEVVVRHEHVRQRLTGFGGALDLLQSKAAVMRSAQAIEELVGLELPGTLGRGHIGEGDADITGYFLQLTRIGNRLVNLLGRAQATARLQTASW